MATSTITKMTMPLKYKDATIESVTVSASGYLDISSYKPTGMNNFLFCMLQDFTVMNPKGAISVTSNGALLVTAANTSITNLKIRYFYTD